MSYDFKEIRKLIEAAFTEEDFREFCFDHFRDVERDFTQGQTQSERVLKLIRYAETRGELEISFRIWTKRHDVTPHHMVKLVG
jgi:Effector-associated domain 7